MMHIERRVDHCAGQEQCPSQTIPKRHTRDAADATPAWQWHGGTQDAFPAYHSFPSNTVIEVSELRTANG